MLWSNFYQFLSSHAGGGSEERFCYENLISPTWSVGNQLYWSSLKALSFNNHLEAMLYIMYIIVHQHIHYHGLLAYLTSPSCVCRISFDMLLKFCGRFRDILFFVLFGKFFPFFYWGCTQRTHNIKTNTKQITTNQQNTQTHNKKKRLSGHLREDSEKSH